MVNAHLRRALIQIAGATVCEAHLSAWRALALEILSELGLDECCGGGPVSL